VIISSFQAWTVLNVLCILIVILSVKRIFANKFIQPSNVTLVLTNFSVLSWIFVPDTFVVGITFFVLGVVLYNDGKKRRNVFLSGVVASSMNLFFFLPWMLAHFFLGRQLFFECMKRAIQVLFAVLVIAISAQFFQKYRPASLSEASPSVNPTLERYQYFPFYDQPGLLSSVDSLGWVHSPFMGFGMNLVSFFSAPWTQGYRYAPETWAIHSQLFPVLILIVAICLSLLSFLGIYLARIEFRTFFVFCCGLEISVCLLFLTYSIHPFLFAPFLIFSRISGLIILVNKYEFISFPVTLTSTFLTFFSLNLIF
jgi:hypothetical protein